VVDAVGVATTTNLQARIKLLRSLPTLRAYSDTELAELATLVGERSTGPGQVLVREGDPACASFVIVEGTARVTRRGTCIAALGPGQFVGEMSMFDNAPHPATVTAETPLRVLLLDDKVMKLFQQGKERSDAID
jgi:CRP-like cAMP-binding protein